MLDFKNKMTGAFDLLFLLGRGINRFSGTKKEALISLILPLLLFPASLVFNHYYPPKGMETGYSGLRIALTFMTQAVGSFILYNAAMAGISRLLYQRDKFWLFFSAGNWVSAAFGLATVPFALLAVSNIIAREEMDRIFVLLTCYGYIVTACIAFRSFKINWELAGAIAVLAVFIDQELWHAIYIAQRIPIPW